MLNKTPESSPALPPDEAKASELVARASDEVAGAVFGEANRNAAAAKGKPLGRKAYGSIGHLPNSRMGPGDHHVHAGQAKICTEKLRDKRDRVIVQEKLDGSCVAVALLGGTLHPLGRAGWPAVSSKYEQHRLFAQWVWTHESRFRATLREGERIVGEWLAQAHGTRYDLARDFREPFAAFDIMRDDERLPFDEFYARVHGRFQRPTLLHDGGPLSVEEAMRLHAAPENHWPCDSLEGVVYRVERDGALDFLAKYVRPDKQDGCLLPERNGGDAIWNWRPTHAEGVPKSPSQEDISGDIARGKP